jgi:hypothetical protein
VPYVFGMRIILGEQQEGPAPEILHAGGDHPPGGQNVGIFLLKIKNSKMKN